MTTCHVCGTRCERELEPAITRDGEIVLPAVRVADVWTIVMRNGISASACDRCWGLWPDGWKHFPAVGFGVAA